MLLTGDIRFLPSDEPVLLFERVLGADVVLLAFNLSRDAVRHGLPEGSWQPIEVPGPDAGLVDGTELVLPAHAVFAARRID